MKLLEMKGKGAARLRKTFPVRQVYIRSSGRVHFFTFGTWLQVNLAMSGLLFLAWTAFSTANVVFKDEAITAKDSRYQEAQTGYEGRLAQLEISYGGLRSALIQSRQVFAAAAKSTETKQKAISYILALGDDDAATSPVALGAPVQPALRGEIDEDREPTFTFDAGGSGPSRRIDGAPPQSNISDQNSLPASKRAADEVTHAIAQIYSATIRRFFPSEAFTAGSEKSPIKVPVYLALMQQVDRVKQLDNSEIAVLGQTENVFGYRIQSLRGVIRSTGIDPDAFVAKAASHEAVGGPEIPLENVRIEGISDEAFTQSYLRTTALVDRLHVISTAMINIPFSAPVSASSFNRTSGFGPRRDPFTGQYSFHPGIDFGGPWGAPVVATAAGKVVFAGNQGEYGNVVELDHGMGIHTRYAHLSAFAVEIGALVRKGTVIGRVGSTGRSTGSHVHYEIWYDNRVRNPAPFLSAGGHTFAANGSFH